MTIPESLALWTTRLTTCAESGDPPLLGHAETKSGVSEKATYADTFTDEFDHRRTTDGPFLRHLLSVPVPVDELLQSQKVLIPNQPHAALWWRLAANRPHRLSTSESGPLFPELRSVSIESWTEAELAGLHAMAWWLARESSAPLLARVQSHAQFIIDELQPDNATNRPWAIGVFAWLGSYGRFDADHYAQTLLHNCTVTLSKPDRLSALILQDSSLWLGRIVQACLSPNG